MGCDNEEDEGGEDEEDDEEGGIKLTWLGPGMVTDDGYNCGAPELSVAAVNADASNRHAAINSIGTLVDQLETEVVKTFEVPGGPFEDFMLAPSLISVCELPKVRHWCTLPARDEITILLTMLAFPLQLAAKSFKTRMESYSYDGNVAQRGDYASDHTLLLWDSARLERREAPVSSTYGRYTGQVLTQTGGGLDVLVVGVHMPYKKAVMRAEAFNNMMRYIEEVEETGHGVDATIIFGDFNRRPTDLGRELQQSTSRRAENWAARMAELGEGLDELSEQQNGTASAATRHKHAA